MTYNKSHYAPETRTCSPALRKVYWPCVGITCTAQLVYYDDLFIDRQNLDLTKLETIAGDKIIATQMF